MLKHKQVWVWIPRPVLFFKTKSIFFIVTVPWLNKVEYIQHFCTEVIDFPVRIYMLSLPVPCWVVYLMFGKPLFPSADMVLVLPQWMCTFENVSTAQRTGWWHFTNPKELLGWVSTVGHIVVVQLSSWFPRSREHCLLGRPSLFTSESLVLESATDSGHFWYIETRKGVGFGVKLLWFKSRLQQFINFIVLGQEAPLHAPPFPLPLPGTGVLVVVTSVMRIKWEDTSKLFTQIWPHSKCSGDISSC